MKALFYKFSKDLPLKLLLMLYFWMLVPWALCLYGTINLYESPLVFMLAGTIYTFECSSDEKSKFNKYMTSFPIKRSTYVSYIFLLIVISEVIMYFFQILLGILSPTVLERNVMSENTPIMLLSSMCIGIAVVGFAVFWNFKASFRVSGTMLVVLYFFVSFVLGFIIGVTKDSESATALLNSTGFRIVTAVVSLIVFLLEWWLAVRVYNKKDV